MKRSSISPRDNWKSIVESQGLFWHSAKGDYWNESAHYSFTMDEINRIEHATNTLHDLCLKAVQHVIDNRLYEQFSIPEHAIQIIEDSWNYDVPSIYGRFDLAYDGSSIKMLEYNADTPTSLIEASIIQWFWLKDRFPSADQFNSIHERLIEYWRVLIPYLKSKNVHFVHMPDIEDEMTIQYLRDTAEQAGITTTIGLVEEIGLTSDGFFTDIDDNTLQSVFKLYPWEWLINEGEYADALIEQGLQMDWIEPAWKMILSNKAILALLWELNPDHEFLLPASLDESQSLLWGAHVKKPILSREGANIEVSIMGNNIITTYGDYGDDGHVYQQLANIPQINGKYPVIGSWVIGGESAGIGIRESDSIVTDNTSQFVPHIIQE